MTFPPPLPEKERKPRRNDRLVDIWSLTHFGWGFLLAFFFHPLLAFGLLVVWEPVEVLLLSPLLARFGIRFGHEHLKNALSDIVFDGLGVVVGLWVAGMMSVEMPYWALL